MIKSSNALAEGLAVDPRTHIKQLLTTCNSSSKSSSSGLCGHVVHRDSYRHTQTKEGKQRKGEEEGKLDIEFFCLLP